MRFAVICAVWPVLCSAGMAEDDRITVQRPLLWEMRPPNSDVVSYLFGTVHVNHPEITRLHPRAQSAFDSCRAAYFEIDFTRDNGTQAKAISLPDGQTLEQLVPSHTVDRIERRLKDLSPLLTRENLPEYRVVMWPIMLANLEAQVRYLGTLPLDLQLQQAATQAGKVTGGLEDPTSQLKALTGLPLNQQIDFLEASLDVMDEDDRRGFNSLDELVQLYAEGDEKKLEIYLDLELRRPDVSDELENIFLSTLLTDRNHRMVQSIDDRVKQHPQHQIFIAIGAAHLVGDGSVITGLEQRGYVIRRAEAAESSR